jgi:hypothetical protein
VPTQQTYVCPKKCRVSFLVELTVNLTVGTKLTDGMQIQRLFISFFSVRDQNNNELSYTLRNQNGYYFVAKEYFCCPYILTLSPSFTLFFFLQKNKKQKEGCPKKLSTFGCTNNITLCGVFYLKLEHVFIQ